MTAMLSERILSIIETPYKENPPVRLEGAVWRVRGLKGHPIRGVDL